MSTSRPKRPVHVVRDPLPAPQRCCLFAPLAIAAGRERAAEMPLNLQPPFVSDLDLMRISRANPGYRFEREEDGTVIVSPTSTIGGAKSGEAFAVGPGLRVYCPDASWVSQPRIEAQVGTETEDGFWPISPDVAIEAKSRTDDWRATAKGAAIAGARLPVCGGDQSRDARSRTARYAARGAGARLRCDHRRLKPLPRLGAEAHRSMAAERAETNSATDV